MKYNRVFDYVHHHWIGNFVHPLVPNEHTALLVFIVASEEFRNNSNIPRFIIALSFILYLMAQKFNKSWFSRNQNHENTNTQRCCGTLFDAAPDFPHVLSYLWSYSLKCENRKTEKSNTEKKFWASVNMCVSFNSFRLIKMCHNLLWTCSNESHFLTLSTGKPLNNIGLLIQWALHTCHKRSSAQLACY